MSEIVTTLLAETPADIFLTFEAAGYYYAWDSSFASNPAFMPVGVVMKTCEPYGIVWRLYRWGEIMPNYVDIPVAFSPKDNTPTIKTGELVLAFPASSTLYFGANGKTTDANGQYFTTDQGYGFFGITDSNGVLTVDTNY